MPVVPDAGLWELERLLVERVGWEDGMFFRYGINFDRIVSAKLKFQVGLVVGVR
jgi:hypothetical protein